MDLTSAVAVNVNAFVFSRRNKASLPERGRPRARQVVCDIGHFPPVSRQEQRKPASTPWNFFFLSREVSYIHSERFLTFFFSCCVRISRTMNAKNLEIREGRQEQWNSTSTPWNFFFLSREVSYIHSERFLTFFF